MFVIIESYPFTLNSAAACMHLITQGDRRFHPAHFLLRSSTIWPEIMMIHNALY